MNLVDCYVTRVLSEPYEAYNKWWVLVEYDSWGRLAQTTVMCDTEEEAERVDVGYHFLA